MSEPEINEIMRVLGRIEERTETLMRRHDQTIEAIEALKKNGCAIGEENKKAIIELKTYAESTKAIGRKLILIALGVGVGSVGVKEVLQGIIQKILGQ